MQAYTLLFSAAMKCIGKQDGKTVPIVLIQLTAHWYVIKKEHWEKMYAVQNETRHLTGQVCGEMDVIILRQAVANLRTH